MKIKKQVIFVPGFTELHEGGWPDWLAGQLAKFDLEFKFLTMPDPICPEVHQWVDHLKKQNIKITENTYFVGHSLGCITIARFLEKLPQKDIAGGCIFVSGFSSLPKLPLLDAFTSLPLDFSEVKKHARDFIVITSDDDRIIPPRYSKEFAEKLGARIIVDSQKGHFETNIKEAPVVLNCILELEQMREENKEISKLRKIKK